MKINGFISTVMLTGLLLIATLGDITHAQDAADWMPDPNLHQAISKTLGIETLTIADMQRLYHLEVSGGKVIHEVSGGKVIHTDLNEVRSLKGLEHAINLKSLVIVNTKVSDLTPLSVLENLHTLKLTGNQISDITPLAGLVNLEILILTQNQIVDITPLAGLINLRRLQLNHNQIEDISPLRGLVNLQHLQLQHNQIVDISPLRGLLSLKVLNLGENPIIDLTPIYGLVGIEALDLQAIPMDFKEFQRLNPVDRVVCNIERAPILPRIENIQYPSIFQACGFIVNRPELSWVEQLASHDLFFCRGEFGVDWIQAPDRMVLTLGEAKVRAKEGRDRNPNILLLASIEFYGASPESPYALRDESGNVIIDHKWDGAFADFRHPDIQKRFIEKAHAIARCGLFDGIAIDHWTKPGLGDITPEETVTAKDRMIQGIRDAVGEDFLILITTSNEIMPTRHHAEYINGFFMETIEGYEGGYTYAGLSDIENTLLWAEENLREPQINCLAGRGVRSELLDSPRNLQWMRLWTTMSLTHSDGYVMFTMGGNLEHPAHSFEFLPGHADDHAQGKRHSHQNTKYWYDFWDAPLGQPVGGDETKAQLYKTPKGITIEGLFIREFTNGWAVYNRSGKSRMIQLPEKVSGIESGVENKRWHTIPDLDGEIYLKEVVPLDTTRPEVSIAVSSDTQDGAFDAVITFTEPVSDFGQTDVSISGTATATITAWTISADNTTYTATITPTTSGTLILNINEDVAADDTSNPNTPATQQTLTVQLIPKWDVNRDGQVNVLDLVAVANAFGKDAPDVNGDGVVNILDLVAVAQHFGDATTAAPSILAMSTIHGLDAATVQAWIERAQLENDGSITFQEAIANLQRLLASLIPKETTLLANYPNPFNPETWIPYHLANPSHVRFTIYDALGTVVRQLDLGHQREGYYTTRSRAAYWDGRNAVGERLASGIYFYQLQADQLSFLQKMVILK